MCGVLDFFLADEDFLAHSESFTSFCLRGRSRLLLFLRGERKERMVSVGEQFFFFFGNSYFKKICKSKQKEKWGDAQTYITCTVTTPSSAKSTIRGRRTTVTISATPRFTEAIAFSVVVILPIEFHDFRLVCFAFPYLRSV